MEGNLPLTVEVLHRLAGHRLAERLGFAVRLWVLINKFYGEDQEDFRDLPRFFSYADLRDRLLSQSHPKNDPTTAKPAVCPDQQCICHLSLEHWLNPELRQELQHTLGLTDEIWQQKLAEKVFGHSHRTLRKALPYLVEHGWLKSSGNAKFSRLDPEDLPTLPAHTHSGAVSIIRSLDILNDIRFIDPRLSVLLAEIQASYYPSRQFFVHFDYILSPQLQDHVDNLQSQLHELFAAPETPPVQLDYSTRLRGVQQLIVYPVCLFYARRAKYLSAYGQTPNDAIGWHNFRLDRITSRKFALLPWTDRRIPAELLFQKNRHQLPNSEDVEMAWQEAWGTDFYLPKALMILRFRQDFAQRYVEGTERHPTFQRIPYREIPRLIHRGQDRQSMQQILHIWQRCSAEDAYYQAQVRVGDTNLVMRLRDWRPNGEVIAPLELRAQMQQEAQQELSFYR